MVRDGNFELFQNDSIDKQLKIEYDNGTITNTDIHQEQFELNESLCSKQTLRFGCCESGSIKFRISNVFEPLKDKWLSVSMTLEGNREEPFAIGQYKVVSDVPTANKKFRDVIAYDSMYDIVNAEVSEWYNTLLPDKYSTTTLKAFRDSFFNYLGIEQEEAELPNDGMTVKKTIEPSELSGGTVITCICEINGCFGHITRAGQFRYVYLERIIRGLFPADTLFPRDDLYPSDHGGTESIRAGTYISAQYEDFETKTISRLVIRQEENDIGGGYGTGDNIYVIQDNFLVYGKSAADIDYIAELIMGKIDQIWYRPTSIYAKGNPCFEVGDGIRLNTKREIIYTYVLKRTLKGIQALKDTYGAEGEEYQQEQVNSTQNSIIQLRGKTNTLTRTVEENRLEVLDIAEGLSSRITQNASSITAEVSRATIAEGALSSRISINAESITAEVTRATTEEGSLSTRITANAESITFEVTRAKGNEELLSSRITQTATDISTEVTRASEAEGKLSARITQNAENITAEITRAGTAEGNLSARITANANSITSEVTRATAAEGSLSSRITQNADAIDLRVTKDGVVSAINISPETITISANKINVDGLLATTQFQAQTARIRNLEVDHVSIADFNAAKARIGSLEADHVTVSDFNAVSGRVGSLEADHVTTAQLNATNAKFNSLNASNITAGTLSVDRLDVDSLASTAFKTRNVNTYVLTATGIVTSEFTGNNLSARDGTVRIKGKSVSWTDITVAGTTYTVLTG